MSPGAAPSSRRRPRSRRSTDTQKRAFDSELGVQAPVDLWDPPAFTGDGSEDNFQDHMVLQDGPGARGPLGSAWLHRGRQ